MGKAINVTDDKNDVSAKRKLLSLASHLGLATDGQYQPAKADLFERTQYRLNKQQATQQKNLESIYKQALELTPSDVTGIDLDPDWLHRFYALAEHIHNPKMQNLWARILAKEITSPGHFSVATLTLLTQLTQREAQILEKVLGVACIINNDRQFKLLNHYRITSGWRRLFAKSPKTTFNLAKSGIPYSYIVSLTQAGILLKEEFETGKLNHKQSIVLNLNKDKITITPKHSNLVIGYFRFTTVGNELAQLISVNALHKQYKEYFLNYLKTKFHINDRSDKL